MNVVKLLPPLICGQEEVDYFAEALDDRPSRRQSLIDDLRLREDARAGFAASRR